jgi:hypothetical protein
MLKVMFCSVGGTYVVVEVKARKERRGPKKKHRRGIGPKVTFVPTRESRSPHAQQERVKYLIKEGTSG